MGKWSLPISPNMFYLYSLFVASCGAETFKEDAVISIMAFSRCHSEPRGDETRSSYPVSVDGNKYTPPPKKTYT